MEAKKSCGFTLIELLVVIAVIALLMAVILPALGKAKEYAQKIVCRSNVRQQVLGVILYADDNDSSVPNANVGFWLWDLSFRTTNLISDYAGFDDNEIFSCPANKSKKVTDARCWQYRWLDLGTSPMGNGPFPQEVGLMDESVLSQVELQDYYRRSPFLYMFDRYNSNGMSALDSTLETGEKAFWIRKLSNITAPGSRTMIVDAVISNQNDWEFFDMTAGGIYNLSGQTLTNNSNHRSRQRISDGTNQGSRPAGANIGYADGHADWRQFDDMQHAITMGMWFWW